MSDKLDYLLADLDFYLAEGFEPDEAWHRALEDYTYVYAPGSDETPLALASSRMLRYMKEAGYVKEEE